MERLTETLKNNELRHITVAPLKVRCCTGFLALSLQARRSGGKEVTAAVNASPGPQIDVLAPRVVSGDGLWAPYSAHRLAPDLRRLRDIPQRRVFSRSPYSVSAMGDEVRTARK